MRRKWKKENDKLLVASIVIISVVILDQITKSLSSSLGLAVVCNSGYAFGIMRGYLNVLIIFLVLLIAVYNFSKAVRFNLWIGWAFVLGGGLGNMADRLIRGCVIDFVKVVAFWPSFNLADAAISIGMMILIFSLIRERFQKN